MSAVPDELLVHLDDSALGGDAVAGQLRRVQARGDYLVSFSFSNTFLPRATKPILDPTLGVYLGDQYPQPGPLFGAFTDAAPDRWGRYLLQRHETQLAREEHRRGRQLDDWDYLVGVSDDLRMGALRLQVRDEPQFVSSDLVSVPPMARLRVLQSLASRAERGDDLSDQEASNELRLLIAPGASLGGARPKANVRDRDDALWIAKFASYNDTYDAGACEYILTKLGELAGITTPPIQQQKLGRFTTFMSKRFDRVPAGRRHFASAMTLLGKRDHDEASYLDIAEAIVAYGDAHAIKEDLGQLFRRVVFNVLTAHRDDHMRNHGFLATKNGWRLSPAFDVNPVPNKTEHELALDATDHAPDLNTVLETARTYRLSARQANDVVSDVRNHLKDWRAVASSVTGDATVRDVLGAAISL